MTISCVNYVLQTDSEVKDRSYQKKDVVALFFGENNRFAGNFLTHDGLVLVDIFTSLIH